MSSHPPDFIELCLPTVSRTVPTGPQWVYEIKHDGFRFICRRNGDRVRLFSRGGHDWSAQLPAIVEAMRAFPVTSVTLDGEVLDQDQQPGAPAIERVMLIALTTIERAMLIALSKRQGKRY